jgi:hypothetical protein
MLTSAGAVRQCTVYCFSESAEWSYRGKRNPIKRVYAVAMAYTAAVVLYQS